VGIGEIAEIVIVDKNNKIIGKILDKDRLDHKEIISRCSVVVISDNEENILLQKRSKHKYIYPFWWDNSAGGILKTNQTDNECIIEELSEELGINLTITDLEDCGITYIEHVTKEFIHVYKYKTKQFTPKINWEVEDTAWMNSEEIEKTIKSGKISPVCLAAMKKAEEKQKQKN